MPPSLPPLSGTLRKLPPQNPYIVLPCRAPHNGFPHRRRFGRTGSPPGHRPNLASPPLCLLLDSHHSGGVAFYYEVVLWPYLLRFAVPALCNPS